LTINCLWRVTTGLSSLLLVSEFLVSLNK